MPTMILRNPSYTNLDTVTWCASAQFISQNQSHSKRQQQRAAVRLLLQNLLSERDIIDRLEENQFPYRLLNSRYYVCFSHSSTEVAVVISHQRAVGIDIETNDISWQVIKRFYHPAEIKILAELPIEQRTMIAKWLWQLKESFIKIHHYKLTQGLGINYASIVPTLMASPIMASPIMDSPIMDSPVQDHLSPSIMTTLYNGYQVTVLPNQQMVIVF